jgi:hypothetical protein
LILQEFPSRFTNYDELREYLVRLKRGEQKIQEYNNFSARYLSNSGMRDGMAEAWGENWEKLTSEGGKFYEPPKQKRSQPITPTNQLPETIRRPETGGAGGGGLDDSTESILQELGI